MECRWVQARRLAVVVLAAVVALMVGCRGGGSDGGDVALGPGPTTPEFQSPAVNPSPNRITEEVFYSTLTAGSTTVPIATETSRRIQKVSADGWTLKLPNDPAFANIGEGSTLVAPVTPEFPEGLVRYVVKVIDNGPEKVVETRVAALDEVFENGEMGLADIIDEGEVVEFLSAPEYDPNEAFDQDDTTIPEGSVRVPGVPGRGPRFQVLSKVGDGWVAPPGFRPAIRPIKVGSGFYFEINKILFDKDFNLNTTDDQFKVQAKFVFDPRLAMGCTIQEWKLTRALFKVSFDGELDLKIGADVPAKYSKAIELGRKKLQRKIVGYAGPVPIWITPEIPINLVIGGAVNPPVYTQASYKLSIVGGVEMVNGKTNLIKKFEQSSSYEANDPEGSIEVKAGIRPELVIFIEGLVGPKFGLEMFAKLIFSPLRVIALDLLLGITGGVGIELEVFSKKFYNGYWDLFTWEKSVWQKKGPLITIPYTPPDPKTPIVLTPAGYSPETLTSLSPGGASLIPDPTNIAIGNGHRLLMNRVEPQTFTMGGTVEPNAFAATVSKPFWMGRYEVTQAQYQQIMGVNPSTVKPSTAAELASWPVQNVSWFDAISFCNQLSYNLGLRPCYRTANGAITFDATANGFRLPTEAEWELAAQEANTDQQLDQQGYAGWDAIAWFWDNIPSTTATTLGKGPMAIGRKRANANSLYDMRGNVAEWVWDFHAPYTSNAKTNPTGPTTGTYRVIRGGSWDARSLNYSALYRTARDASGPTARNFSTGFRVARNAE